MPPRPIRVLLFGLALILIVSLSSYHYGDPEKLEGLRNYAQREKQDPVLSFKASVGSIKDVRNSTLGFQKIFVINLPERADKLDAFTLASSLTGFEADWIEGIRGNEVSNKSLPSLDSLPSTAADRNSIVGCWRAHLNFARTMINQRLASALVIEDDADWDTHLKDQLDLFAQGSQYVTGTPSSSHPSSPYGDDWDMLWLGHCGAQIHDGDERRFIIENDATVPSPSRRFFFSPDIPDLEREKIDNSTRLVFEAGSGLCTYAYALSQRGAHKLLYAQSTMTAFTPIDLGIANLCRDSPNFTCVGVFPPLIGSYKGAGRVSRHSDIMAPTAALDEEISEKGYTHNIVYSTMLNLDLLLRGKRKEVERQSPEDPVVEGPATTRTLNRVLKQ